MLPASLTTGYQGRLLALLLLLVVPGAVYLVVAAPLIELYASREAGLENKRMLVPRLKAAADQLPALRARVTQLRASANLQSHIEELATSAGVTIGSTESLPVEVRGGYRAIGLRYTLTGPYEALVKLLAKLEAATPPLVIENLHIHGVLRRPGTPMASALDAGLDVIGFRNNDKTAAAKS